MIKNLYKRPLSIIAFFVLLFFLGVLSIFKLNVALLPSMEYGVINIETEYEDATAAEVEEKITNVIEKTISAIPGLKYYKSISYNGRSLVTLIFNETKEKNYDKHYLKVREKVEAIKNMLPEDSHIPIVNMYDPENLPSFVLGLKYSDIEGLSYEEDIPILIRKLESVDGINDVKLKGIPEKKIFIRINPQQLSMMDVTTSEIIESIKANNFDFPGGTVDSRGQEINVNIRGSIKDISRLERLIVSKGSDKKNTIYLSQIADVIQKEVEQNFAVVNGERMILFEVFTSNNTSLGSLSDNIKAVMNSNNLKYSMVADYSTTINRSIDELLISMILGIFFTTIILIGFFGDIRIAILVSIVIPFAVVINLIFMFLFKININMLSLSGLVISVGLIVDNSLVVVDKLQYFGSLKEKRYILKAVNSTIGPLLSSTFTTVIAFLPVIFLTGLTGEFFRQIALSVSMTLFISLFLAFLLIPSLYDYFIRRRNIRGNSGRGIFLHLLKRIVLNTSRFFYRHNITTTLFVFIVSIISIFFLITWNKEFLPESVESNFTAKLFLNQMTPEQISFEIASLNDYIRKNFSEEVNWAAGAEFEKSEATVYFSALNGKEKAIYSGLKEFFKKRGVKADFILNPSWNIPEAFRLLLRLNIFSEDPKVLHSNAKKLEEAFPDDAIIDHISPERVIAIRPDIEKSEMLQIDIDELKNTVRTAYGEFRITELINEDSYIGVDIEPYTRDENIQNLKVATKNGKKVFLKDFANIEVDRIYTPIYHYEGKRFIQTRFAVFSDIENKIKEITDLIKDDDVEFSFTGINETKDEMIKNMMFALIVAIILIYLILVIQYESFKKPFIILFLLPFTFSCSILMWKIYGVRLNLMNMLGIILLSGITVNNSIILLSEIIKRKDYKKAVVSRSRAIFITTLTTVMGSIPMLFGSTAAMRIPLALTVIGGMSISWLVNLIFLPAVDRTLR